MIVAVNKMDMTEPPYSESRFKQVKDEVSDHIKKVGYNLKAVAFVPLSGWHGDNMIDETKNMPWYVGWSVEKKGFGGSNRPITGKTLIDAIDAIRPPVKVEDKPLRIPLQDVYKMNGTGLVPVGRIETGKMRAGYSITFAPSNIQAQVKEVQRGFEDIAEAKAGDNIGFHVKLKDSNVTMDSLKKGHVCGTKGKDPPKEAKSFLAQVSLC